MCENPCSEDEKMLELKQSISEGIVEGAKQQAANLLVSVKKEKMLELVAEKVEKAASSSEIPWFLKMDKSQVREALAIFCLCMAIFHMCMAWHGFINDITAPAAPLDTNYDLPPEGRRRARRA